MTPFKGVFLTLTAHGQTNGSARHIKMFAQPIDQITLIAFGHSIRVRAHHNKARWTGFYLCHIAQLNAPTTWCGRRVSLNHRSKPSVQPRGGDAAVPHIMCFHNRCVQTIKPFASFGRNGDHRRAAQLRQKPLKHFTKGRELILLIDLKIPFIHRNDNGAPFCFGEIGNSQILLLKGNIHIQQHHNHLGESHRAQSI